jgi:hypothetical protein
VGFGQSIRHISQLYKSRCPRSTQLRGHLERAQLHGIRDCQFCTQDRVGCGAWLSQTKRHTGPRCAFPPVAVHRQSSIRAHYDGLRLIDAVESFESKSLAVRRSRNGQTRDRVSLAGASSFRGVNHLAVPAVVNLSHSGKILRRDRPRQPSGWPVVRASRTLDA